ncbi:Glucose-6-phosphate isomerase [Methyloligella halotolerans]|uniref:Glucose-6-phosphate isomerase n=1 Tax=Methyloligella halotolerans TaxID=1177755 RepID=A0A1E2RYT3_9HYPH|nr:hypothetical protein [Methyloligella halotolerans]ODA67209.1 Glucose-6-phosphate isomerase [Methyloligella halotolerans]
MAFKQGIDGCLEQSIGAGGLSDTVLDQYLEKLGPRMHSLHEAYESGSLPILRVAERRDDIEPMREAFEKLTEGAKTIVFFGTGGSSLGGQTIAQLGGWDIPGDNGGRSGPNPRTRFYDNLDARTLERALANLDLETTRFILISKSGGTPETLVQSMAALQAVRHAGLEDKADQLFLGLTEPAQDGKKNGLRDLCDAFGIPTLPHDTGIGGRFSALTNTGLLAALARGIDPVEIREGAGQVISALMSDKNPRDFAPAIGAALQIGLAKEKGVKATIMLPYSDSSATSPPGSSSSGARASANPAKAPRRWRPKARSTSIASFSSTLMGPSSTSSPCFAPAAPARGRASRRTSPRRPMPTTSPARPRATSSPPSRRPSQRL